MDWITDESTVYTVRFPPLLAAKTEGNEALSILVESVNPTVKATWS